MSKLMRSRWRLFVVVVLLSTLTGVVEGYFAHYEASHTRAEHVLGSAMNWFIGSSLISAFEIFFLQSRYGTGIRRLHFLTAIAVKMLLILITVIFVGLLGRLVIHGQVALDFLQEPNFYRILGIVFVVIVTLQTITQIVRIIGGRVLINFILGKYHRPVREDTLFLFLDLAGSTALAEDLGDVGVQTMITDFFFDITEPIIEHEGEIHRYVGDQVVVTWPMGTGPDNARAVICCFAIIDFIEARAQVYQKKFGVVPRFRIGLHGGPVVISECGDQKQELSYFGDTVNTAARIEQQCKTLDEPLLISADLLAQTDLPDEFQSTRLGEFHLKGRHGNTELFSITRRSSQGQAG